MTFTYKNGTLTITNNGSTVKTTSLNLTRDDITVWVGSDSGGGNAINATIMEFSINRL